MSKAYLQKIIQLWFYAKKKKWCSNVAILSCALVWAHLEYYSVLCDILGNSIKIILKMVTKISKPLKEIEMVSMKNERRREKIIALSNITKGKIIFWWIVELPTYGGGWTHWPLRYCRIQLLCITCPKGNLEGFKEKIQDLK